MNKVYTTLLLGLMSLMNISLAQDYVSVEELRGEVTVLPSGYKQAIKLDKDMKIPIDSSIVTKERSYVRLVYPDKSKVVLGPNSKIVIQLIETKTQPSFITLLKGQIRAKIQKESGRKSEKFIINTRMAALGVRGTEFQVGVSEDSHTTSLLTYEGNVAIQANPITVENVKNAQESVINGEEVKAGQYSNAKSTREVLKPIIIDKNQLASMERNETMIAENSLEVKKVSDPVVDFKSGKVFKEKDVEIDENGSIVDPRITPIINKPSNPFEEVLFLMDSHPNHITFLLQRNSLIYKNQGTKHYFDSTELGLLYEKSIVNDSKQLIKLGTSVSYQGKPDLKSMKNGPSQLSGIDLKDSVKVKLLASKIIKQNNMNQGIEVSLGNESLYEAEGAILKNKIKPKFNANYILQSKKEKSNSVMYEVKIGIVSLDKEIGFHTSLGLSKNLSNKLSLGGNIDYGQIKDQSEGNIRLSIGWGF